MSTGNEMLSEGEGSDTRGTCIEVLLTQRDDD